MDPEATISASVRTNGPPEPSIILPMDPKKTSLYGMTRTSQTHSQTTVPQSTVFALRSSQQQDRR